MPQAPSKWSPEYIAKLPDSAFLWVAPGGKKSGGITSPTSYRHFPVKDASGAVDRSRMASALTRFKAFNHPKLTPQIKATVIRAAAASMQGGGKSGGKPADEGKAGKKMSAVSFPDGQSGLVLLADDSMNAFAFDAISGTQQDGGIPVQRFKRVIMRTGKWTHPTEGWTANVTPEFMDRMVENFHAMANSGVEVDAVRDHSFKSNDHLGFIRDVWREGDDLYADHEFRGNEAIQLARRLPRTSVWIQNGAKDAHGNEYDGPVLIHNSISQGPVIPGMHDDFIEYVSPTLPSKAIAASLGGSGKVPVCAFAGDADGGDAKDNGDGDGDGKIAVTDDMVTKIAEATGLDGLTAENLLERLAEFKGGSGGDADIDAAIAEAMKALDQVAPETKAEDKSGIDPDTAELLAAGTEALAASCVSKGCITPAVAKKLEAILIGTPGARNGFALSSKFAGGSKPLAMAIYEALAENVSVDMGERTGAQIVSMARNTPGGEGSMGNGELAKQMLIEAGSRAAAL